MNILSKTIICVFTIASFISCSGSGGSTSPAGTYSGTYSALLTSIFGQLGGEVATSQLPATAALTSAYSLVLSDDNTTGTLNTRTAFFVNGTELTPDQPQAYLPAVLLNIHFSYSPSLTNGNITLSNFAIKSIEMKTENLAPLIIASGVTHMFGTTSPPAALPVDVLGLLTAANQLTNFTQLSTDSTLTANNDDSVSINALNISRDFLKFMNDTMNNTQGQNDLSDAESPNVGVYTQLLGQFMAHVGSGTLFSGYMAPIMQLLDATRVNLKLQADGKTYLPEIISSNAFETFLATLNRYTKANTAFSNSESDSIAVQTLITSLFLTNFYPNNFSGSQPYSLTKQ